MPPLRSDHLLLGAAAHFQQLSLNPTAWSNIERQGLVLLQPLVDGFGPAVVVTISESGRVVARQGSR